MDISKLLLFIDTRQWQQIFIYKILTFQIWWQVKVKDSMWRSINENPCGINTIIKISTTRGPDIYNLKSYNLPMIFEGIFLSLFSNDGYIPEIIRIL